jgi:hypothetical protein
MNLARFLLYSLTALSVAACGRSAPHGPRVWSFWLENHSGETFSNVAVIYRGETWAVLGDSGGGMSVVGELPTALDVTFTDRDGGHHKVHVSVPPIPSSGSKAPLVYLVFEARDKVTAYASNPEDIPGWTTDAERAAEARQAAQYEKNKIAYTFLNRTGETLSDLRVHFDGQQGTEGWPAGNRPPGSAIGMGMSPPREIKTMDLTFTTFDGAPHKIHVVMPPVTRNGTDTPHIYVVVESPDKLTASLTNPESPTSSTSRP